jgi:aromatic ring hydroxylase
MPLRTPQQYIESLRDGRVVYYRGERVADVTTHAVIGIAVRHAAIDYEMAEEPALRDLCVAEDEAGAYSRYYHIPRTADDLLKRSALIEEATRRGGTLVVLAKEIGTDALFGLHIVAAEMDEQLGTTYLPRVQAFYRHCRDNDLAIAVAQTDVKGDRSLGPSAQPHPDYYVRVVDENAQGIVIRGAKVHTSITPNCNEIIVLPTRAMGEADRDYAVACAVPANAQGLTMIASPYGGTKKNAFEYPLSAKHKMIETLTVFDDVFVPWERVFMRGEWQFAGPLAKTFVEYHRFTAISYKLPLLDLFVGAGRLIAEYNGIERAPHVRDKLARLIAYSENVRGLTRLSAIDCHWEHGLAVPNTLLVNLAKLHFASRYHEHVAIVQDLAGGLLVTAPGEEDWQNPETRPYLERYLGGKAGVSAEDRMRLMHLISDLTAADFGGYQAVLAVHAEGSIEAEKLQMYREYDMERVTRYAKALAGIG